MPAGAPGRILDAVRQGRITALASWELAEEIVEVLRRPRMRRYRISERDIADLLTVLGPLLPAVEVMVAPRDRTDIPVIATALAGRADAIVTGDRGLLGDDRLRAFFSERAIAVYAPAELLERL